MARRGSRRILSLTLDQLDLTLLVLDVQLDKVDPRARPLHVDVPVLVVDLKRVHLTITADPAGRVPGRLFCGPANTP